MISPDTRPDAASSESRADPGVTDKTRVHLVFIDGIRAVLALTVLLTHAMQTVGYSVRWGMLAMDPIRASLVGHWAVDYFIVLSGFCLALPLAGNPTRARSVPVGLFLVRRFIRIVLPYWASILVCLLLIWTLIGTPTGTLWDVAIPVSAKDVLHHFLLLQTYTHATPKINHVYWSIAVEFHIYFLFPLIFFLLHRCRNDRQFLLTVGLMLIASFMLFKGLDRYFGYQQSMHYSGLFCLGVAGCFVFEKRFLVGASARWCVGALVGLVAAGCVIKYSPLSSRVAAHVFDYLVGATGICVCLFLAKSPESLPRRWLSGRLICFIGSFAFSLYLLHGPILQIIWQYLLPPWHRQGGLCFILLCGAGTLLSCLSAYAFYQMVEFPCHRLSRSFGQSARVLNPRLAPARDAL